MTVGCEYTRISLLFQCLSSVNFTLLLHKPEMFYNSISLTIKSKIQPYPIRAGFVRVRHTGAYRVPHAVGVNPQHAHYSKWSG